MNRKNLRYRAIGGLGAALLLLTACSPSGTATSTSAARPPAALEWLVVAEGAALDREWGAYEVLAAISRETGVAPTLTYLAGSAAAQTVVKRLQAGDCPDLLTISVWDPLHMQLGHIPTVRTIDDIPALSARIPEEVQDLHRGVDGRLHYLPGGFDTRQREAVPAEGLYVRREMLDLLGLPTPTDADGLLTAVAVYSDWYGRHRPDAYQGCVPMVFGLGGQGLDTLEHFYGRAPLGGEGPSAAVTAFLSRLGEAGGSWAGMQATEATLDGLLRDQCLFYIGSAAPIERYNRLHPQEVYSPLWPVFASGGFLMAEPRGGEYATYIGCGDDRLREAVSLLAYMLSEEGSRTALYGVRDRHWAMDDTGEAVLFPDVRRSAEEGGTALFARTGIGLFPYVSRLGASYPGLRQSPMAVRDLLPAYLSSRIDPTTEEGLQRSRLREERLAAYRQVLGGGYSGD